MAPAHLAIHFHVLCFWGVEQIGDVGLDGISNTIATYNSSNKITTRQGENKRNRLWS